MTVNQYQEDIFSDWKTQKFIVVEVDIATDYHVAHLVVLTDIHFWADHADELVAWCAEHPGVCQKGMTVSFDSRDLLLLFTLRWS